jgi:hypothetical protein
MVAHALGLKTSPASTLSVVSSMQTCSYAGVKLTVSTGLTVLKNPAPPLKLEKVAGLAHGTFTTYAGSTQTQITFYKGTAATGIYGVVRNFGKIRKAKLVVFAKALYAAMGSGASGSQPAGVQLVSSS